MDYFQEILKVVRVVFCCKLFRLGYDECTFSAVAIIFSGVIVNVGFWRLFVNWIWVKCYVTIFFGIIYAVVNVIVVIFECYRYRIFKFCSMPLDLFNKFDVSVDLVF